jgi:hypothetical protein
MYLSSMGMEFRLIFDNSNDDNNTKATLGVAPPYVIVVCSIRSNSTTISRGSTASVANTGCNFISVRSAPVVSPLAYASRYFPSVMNVIGQAPVLNMGVSFAIDVDIVLVGGNDAQYRHNHQIQVCGRHSHRNQEIHAHGTAVYESPVRVLIKPPAHAKLDRRRQ